MDGSSTIFYLGSVYFRTSHHHMWYLGFKMSGHNGQNRLKLCILVYMLACICMSMCMCACVCMCKGGKEGNGDRVTNMVLESH